MYVVCKERQRKMWYNENNKGDIAVEKTKSASNNYDYWTKN